jgi:hypothetical protein
MSPNDAIEQKVIIYIKAWEKITAAKLFSTKIMIGTTKLKSNCVSLARKHALGVWTGYGEIKIEHINNDDNF